ncbi:MAG TPA: Plug domain-containing protein, partial [Opitutus sp.]|nr:Plug domain-containing protein [Opitutus sp.]
MKTPCVHPLVALLGILLVSSAAQAQTAAAPTELSPVLVTATRSAEAAGYVPFSHVTLEGDALRASPHATLDAALRGVGGFSLFRRSDSLTAHPTAQGVSLRGIGPSGASRSLILLDGVPLNDPFGGWVAWTKVPRESLARVELVPGGGAASWGNSALGGVMQLFTEAPLGRRQRLLVRGGSLGTRDAEAQLTEPLGRGTGTLQLLGR